MNTLITGDSHVFALRRGAASLPDHELDGVGSLTMGSFGNAGWFSHHFAEATPDGVKLIRDDFAEAFRNLTGADVIPAGDSTLYGFSLGFHSVTVFRHRVWQHYAPWNSAAEHKRTPVSTQTFEAIIDGHTRQMFAFLAELKKQGTQFFVIEAPPPRRDHPCLEKTPAALVLEIDRRFRASSADKLQDMEIPVVELPSWARGEDGFMAEGLEDAREGDYHHANDAFGARMMKEAIIPFLRARAT